jgi:FtsP/CotA-like multicopper oxidase with cupredoxin domain
MPDIDARRSGKPQPSVRTAVAVVAVAIAVSLAPASLAAQTCPGPAFKPVGQIEADGGTLAAVIKVVSGPRSTPGATNPLMLRYFSGYNQFNPNQKWPTDPSVAGPGPTLRAGATDKVNITLLNQVNVEQFGGTLDAGERGQGTGCDEAAQFNADGTIRVENFYPANDKYPNCFHGSSSANLHFHGAHVTPSTTGDNVLINVRPNLKITENDVKASFAKIFEHCSLGHEPQKWEDLPPEYRTLQETLLREYDKTAPYIGPGRNPDGHGLPENQQLWRKNQDQIDLGHWPQWYSGAYPYCFQFPQYGPANPDIRMGQAPGTHWYHSHKHGSTSVNLFNGLSGAMILTDNSPTGYDGKLRAFYGGNLDEKVLVLQVITNVVNLTVGAGSARQVPPVLVNGQQTPTIQMKKGEVQLWRFVNATVQSFVKGATFTPAGITFKQTAQDGVQLAWQNYNTLPNTSVTMSPANRVDLLVQAPATAGCFTLQDPNLGTLLYVQVTNDSVPAKGFPTAEKDYPVLPEYLWDIDWEEANNHQRTITYGSVPGNPNPPAGTRSMRQFKINNRQFEDKEIDELIKLDIAEEWTIYSTDDGGVFPRGGNLVIGHPFHIHINPFQVIEVFDPNTMTTPQRLPPPWIWWDTFAIPLAKVTSDQSSCPIPLVEVDQVVNGQIEKVKVCPGYYKFLSRFVDFTGEYVEHCHILAHEDRGMMQLIKVDSNKSVNTHH